MVWDMTCRGDFRSGIREQSAGSPSLASGHRADNGGRGDLIVGDWCWNSNGYEVSNRIWILTATIAHRCSGLRRRFRYASHKRTARFLAAPTPAGKAVRNRLPFSIS